MSGKQGERVIGHLMSSSGFCMCARGVCALTHTYAPLHMHTLIKEGQDIDLACVLITRLQWPICEVILSPHAAGRDMETGRELLTLVKEDSLSPVCQPLFPQHLQNS